MSRSMPLTALRLALLASAALPGSALAQEATEVEEVTVTAQKRTQDLLDVGGSVSVVAAEQVAGRRVEQVRDLAALAPNLDVKEQVPGAMPVITVRGVGLDDFSSTNNPSAGIYIDEVYLASLAQMSFDFFDIERVELLKGPQGTLYGRNSTAGALNILTAKPSLAGFSARAAASYGNYQAADVEGMVNLPLGETVALRLAAKGLRQGEGFWFNRAIGEDIGRRKLALGRAQLRWTPSEDLDVIFKLEGQRARSEMGQGEFFGYVPTPGAPCPGDPACANLFGYSDPDGDPFTGDWSGDHFYDIDQVAATLRIERRIGEATLTSVTGYANFARSFYIDTDASPLRLTDFIQTDKVHQLSQELRLSGETGKASWLVGGFYSRDGVRVYTPAFFENLFNTRLRSTADQETTSAAAFAHAEWSLSDRLSLVTGLRYTWEKKSNLGQVHDLVALCPASFLTMAPCGTPPIRIAFVDDTIRDKNWSWKLGLNYKPTPLTLLYLSASQGVKSGGFFSGFATSSAQLQAYEPERLIAYEAGWKTRLPEAGLSLSASAFYYDYKDVQTFIRDTSGALPIQRLGNVGKAELYGLDAEATWRPAALAGLTLQAGVGLLRAELGAFTTADGPVAGGNRLPNAPKVTFNLQARYERAVAEGWRLALQGAGHYSDDVFKDAINDPLVRQESYWSWDGRVALIGEESGLEFALWGKNLGDERHLTQGLNLPALGYGNRNYNAPRTYGVSIAKRW